MAQPSELEKLKSTRKSLRSSLTKLINKTTEILTGDTIDNDEIDDIKIQLIENAEQVFNLDSEVQKHIDNLDTLEKDVASSQEYREKVTKAKAKINRYLKRNGLEEKESKINSSIKFSPNPEDLRNSNHSHVRLPKLTIEPFDGKYENWQEFWGQFEVAIHENVQLSDVEKLNYLKIFLKGSALKCIQGLALTQDNYKIAIELLRQRFGNTEFIVRSHVNKLLNLNTVKSSANLKELRQLHDTCIIQTRSLETAGVEINNYGGILFPILIKLIPEDIVLEYNRSVKGEDSWNCSKLLNFLQSEIETREKTYLFRKSEEFEKNKTKETPFRKSEIYKNTPTAATLNAFIKKECVFCSSSEHETQNCILNINERKSKLLRKGRCFLCFNHSHISKYCRNKNRCPHCNKKHNILICDELEKQKNKTSVDSQSANNSSSTLNCATLNEKSENIFLQTGVALLKNNKRQEIKIKFILDNGSERTFIDEKLSREFNLEILGKEKLTIYAFGSKPKKTVFTNRVKVNLRNIHDPKKIISIEALETPCISEAIIQGPNKEIRKFCEEEKLQLADIAGSENLKMSLLIGSDFYWKIVTGKIKRMSHALVGMETKLGYVFNGSEAKYSDFKSVRVMNAVVHSQNLEETDMLRKIFDIESLGISRSDNLNSTKDNEILKEFENSIRLIDGRYQVNLPWNEHSESLNDNFNNADTRLRTLVKKFKKNTDFHKKYKDIISRHLDEGIAEKIDKNEVCKNSKIYYMPHHAVIREDKITTKMRIVFDASSSETNFPSLNDCLNPGPNLTPDILTLLLQFRLNKVALTADIEGAFLQIALAPEERNAVRFLWVKEDLNAEPEILRMTRVIFGASSSPFLLNATIKHHIRKYEDSHPIAFSTLNNRLYVDDLITSLENENLAYKLYEEIRSILGEASFNMRKWRTNIQTLLDRFKEENNFDESCKVLGYCWNSTDDVLSIDSDKLLKNMNMTELKFTKRGVIRTIGKVFDPLGLISPFAVRAKILLQDIWKKKLDWDENLPPELAKSFQEWCEELFYLKQITIPRHIFLTRVMEELSNHQIHVFVDASKRAYGAVIYARFCNADGKFYSNLITSKAKVAPVQEITLPRLELLAALVGARLFHHIQFHLNLPQDMNIFFWSDSMIVLHWIKNNSRKLKVFVKNRVDEIKKISNPDCWRHCPGNENPADALSRGESLAKLKDQDFWWHGPRWLREDERRWPDSNIDDLQERDLGDMEDEVVTMLVTTKHESLFDIKRFSELRKILRITAWIQRFLHNMRNPQNKKVGALSAEELELAEDHWIRNTQMEHFPEEYSALLQGKPVQTNSIIRTFNPVLSEGKLILVGGRLHQARLSYYEAHPVLLPSKCHLSDLMIKDSHDRTRHGGVTETLTQLRQKTWIIRARQRIKSLIFRCNLCQKLRVKPATQIPAPLPAERITEAYPFQVTGLDYLGPLYIKERNECMKTYILLFTCAVTRAVHLELTPDLTTKTFMQAFRKFVARRGICNTIFSDNAKTFHKANRDLNHLWKIMKNEEVQNLFSGLSIKWNFIVERAAWWGGFWERLVRSVKMSLKKILGKTSVSFQELEVIVIEVEAVLNSRPLTYVFSDPHEPEPLTPGHFLIGRRLLTLPHGRITSTKSDKSELLKMRKYQEDILTQIWKRWRSNYLLELKSAHQYKQPGQASEFKEDTVVLIKDDNSPRLVWKMGVITQTHTGRDGLIRACTVRLPNGSTIRRPVQLLCPLELASFPSADEPRAAEVVAN